jgi:prepilin-type processing-associated H-X9-DG protein
VTTYDTSGYKDTFLYGVKIKMPSSFMLIGDSYCLYFEANNDAIGYQYKVVDPTIEGLMPWVDGTSFPFLGAHGNSGNFAFWDGHAAAFNSTGTFADEMKKEYVANGENAPAISTWNQNKNYIRQ